MIGIIIIIIIIFIIMMMNIILMVIIIIVTISIFLTTNFNTYGITVPKTILLKKFVLISLACSITSTICYLVIKDIDGLNSNIINLTVIMTGFLIFSVIYFITTKLFGVNKLNIFFKN